MKYNFSGIVINKNLKDQDVELSKILNLNLKFDKDISFEKALENNKDKNIIDVYSSNDAMLIITNYEQCFDESYSLKDAHILTFVISQNSTKYYFAYSINEKLIRSISHSDEKIIHEQGLRLKVEDENENISEVIYKQIESILGKGIEDIRANENVKRYLILNNNKSENFQKNIEKNLELPNTDKDILKKSDQRSKNKKIGNLNTIYILVSLAILLFFGLIYVIYHLLSSQ